MKKRFQMRTHELLFVVMLVFCIFISTKAFSFAESQFEDTVRTENAELSSLYDRREALRKSEEEAELIYGWRVFGGVNKRFDRKPSSIPNFTYDATNIFGAQLGLQKQFSFGLQSKLSLNSSQTEIKNGNAGMGTFNSTSWETFPILDLRFPLLAGGFGRQIRADYESQYALKRLEALKAENEYDQKMNDAKVLLWSTILQKELIAAQAETLSRISRIYQIVRGKAERNLEASSNFLQTRSALEQTDLDLKNSQLRFTQLERLLKLVLKKISITEIPAYDFQKFKKLEHANFAGKVTAQERALILSEELARQTAISANEVSRSRLDLVASTSLNGKDPDLNTSWSQSQKGQYPTNYVGIEFNVPLDQGITGRASERQSALIKAATARKIYFQTEQAETLLQDLIARQNQMVDMLELNLKLEKTQTEKLKNERQLLNQGRSSIYQVLQFELDLGRAQGGKFSLALELEKIQQQLLLYRYNTYE